MQTNNPEHPSYDKQSQDPTDMSIVSRKQDHLDLCLNQDVNSLDRNHWDHIALPHCACPNLSLSEICLETTFLGQEYSAPILISSMTGGTPSGLELNLKLAELSANQQIPMGVGSQRVALEAPSKREDFAKLKKSFPRSKLWANIGLVQLNDKIGSDKIKELCDLVEAEALIFHLNPLQEALQPEGDTDFRDLFKKFSVMRKQIHIPIIIKETGCGLDLQTAKEFANLGANALDIAGLGGTHWGYIEAKRNTTMEPMGDWFRNWGIPTPESLMTISKALPNMPLIASGGIRNGLDAAKSLYLGATMAGLAKPYLLAAAQSSEALQNFHHNLLHALKVACFCTNNKNFSKKINLGGPSL